MSLLCLNTKLTESRAHQNAGQLRHIVFDQRKLVFKQHYKDWQTSNLIPTFLQHRKCIQSAIFASQQPKLTGQRCLGSQALTWAMHGSPRFPGLATSLAITAQIFTSRNKLMHIFLPYWQVTDKKSKNVPNSFQLPVVIWKSSHQKTWTKSIVMYLPNQINACRTGFYGSINVEHGNKNKKKSRLKMSLTMVSKPTPPTQGVQKKCPHEGQALRGRIWSLPRESPFAMAIAESWSAFTTLSYRYLQSSNQMLSVYEAVVKKGSIQTFLLVRENSRHSYAKQDSFFNSSSKYKTLHN